MTRTRTQLTVDCGGHQANASIERLSPTIKGRQRSEMTWEREQVRYVAYLMRSEDQMLIGALELQHTLDQMVLPN